MTMDNTQIALAVFKKNLDKLIFDASKVLENSPLTLAEVQTLLQGITVGGRKISDVQVVTNLKNASIYLVDLVSNESFALNQTTVKKLNGFIAQEESLEWGVFRGEGLQTADISITGTEKHRPLKTEVGGLNLQAQFEEDLQFLDQFEPFERALRYFLLASSRQYFFDGNKRTALWTANGILMSNGYRPIGIRRENQQAFNQIMIDFYETFDMKPAHAFLEKEWHALNLN